MLASLSPRQIWIAIGTGAALLLVLIVFALITPSSGLTALSAENQRLHERIEHLRSALNRFSADQADVATVIEELEAELAQLRRDYQNLVSTADNTQQRLDNANARLNQLAELERENRALQQRSASLQQQLDASRADALRLQEQIDNPTNPVSDLY